MTEGPLPIAVLISGGGTTLRNLIALRDQGELAVDFRLVISSRASAGGIRFAEEAGIPHCVIPRKRFDTPEAYRDAMFTPCREHGVALVVMGGFLQHLLIPSDFEHRVINIHPSLIPSFCGEGFYGLHVHQAAVDYGVKISGCTVHFVDNQYDHGPIILQRTCPVLPDDTPESLQQRVFREECIALPEAIRWIAQKRLEITGSRKVILRLP